MLIHKNTVTYNAGNGIAVINTASDVSIIKNEVINNTGFGITVGQNPARTLVAQNFASANEAGDYEGVSADAILKASYDNLPATVGARNVSISLA